MENYIKYIIKDFNERLESCNKCINRNVRGITFLSHNSTKLDYIFIAQNPGKGNYNKKLKPDEIIPFGLNDDTNIYHYFFDYFRKKFVEKHNRDPVFYITNIIKCVTIDNNIKDLDMIINCVEFYLLKELAFFKANNKNLKIITLGKIASDVMSNYTKEYHHVFYHPGYLNRKGKQFIEEYIDERSYIFDTI